jgi:hypothetical protein
MTWRLNRSLKSRSYSCTSCVISRDLIAVAGSGSGSSRGLGHGVLQHEARKINAELLRSKGKTLHGIRGASLASDICADQGPFRDQSIGRNCHGSGSGIQVNGERFGRDTLYCYG